MATKLSETEVAKKLAEVPGWALDKGEITRSVQLPNFQAALLYVGAVGLLAEAAGHHPDITINYNRVRLSLVTHDLGGLTDKDFALAAEINKLPLLK